ncbi:hypothetical protein [Alteribacillus sp. HJP-4]|uniref:hypothetical protein n=1 Tax=Alteribacillus sp. HJP-4 TaxID=2775394 RepID=UPI0035CD2A81
MKKKFGIVLAAFVLFAVFVPLTVSAEVRPTGAGEWDYVGSSDFKNRDVDLGLWFTNYVHSGGGNFMACVDPTKRQHSYALWEYDPSASKKVAAKTSNGGCLTFNNIGSYVDGANNKAEFMLSTTNPEGGGGVTFWD